MSPSSFGTLFISEGVVSHGDSPSDAYTIDITPESLLSSEDMEQIFKSNYIGYNIYDNCGSVQVMPSNERESDSISEKQLSSLEEIIQDAQSIQEEFPDLRMNILSEDVIPGMPFTTPAAIAKAKLTPYSASYIDWLGERELYPSWVVGRTRLIPPHGVRRLLVYMQQHANRAGRRAGSKNVPKESSSSA